MIKLERQSDRNKNEKHRLAKLNNRSRLKPLLKNS